MVENFSPLNSEMDQLSTLKKQQLRIQKILKSNSDEVDIYKIQYSKTREYTFFTSTQKHL